jgi:hypothetical protein
VASWKPSLRLNVRLAALLTLAYAPAWRRRCGTEFCALLEELPPTPSVVASATTSAFSTHTSALVAIGACLLGVAASARQPVPRSAKPLLAHVTHVACAFDGAGNC